MWWEPKSVLHGSGFAPKACMLQEESKRARDGEGQRVAYRQRSRPNLNNPFEKIRPPGHKTSAQQVRAQRAKTKESVWRNDVRKVVESARRASTIGQIVFFRQKYGDWKEDKASSRVSTTIASRHFRNHRHLLNQLSWLFVPLWLSNYCEARTGWTQAFHNKLFKSSALGVNFVHRAKKLSTSTQIMTTYM